jgi:hypothetical protein
MSDNLGRPGDNTNTLLGKILATLQFGLVTPPSANVTSIVNNATTNSTTQTTSGISGNVGGYTALIRYAPTVQAAMYSAGNCVGGLITFANALRIANGTGILESLTLSDTSNQAAAMTFMLFNVNPTGASGFAASDKSAFTYGNALLNLIAQVNIGASDYTVINTTAVAIKSGLGIALRGAAGTSLYGVLVTTGTPTWATTSPLNGFLGILQD